MRCPECGYELGDLLGGIACPECGTCSTREQRLPLTPVGDRAIFMGYFAAPLGTGVFALVAGFVAGWCNMDERVLAGLLLVPAAGAMVAAVLSLVASIDHMKRLPRRVASAPVLLLIPRKILIPILAVTASAVITGALALGACVLGGNVGFGTR